MVALACKLSLGGSGGPGLAGEWNLSQGNKMEKKMKTQYWGEVLILSRDPVLLTLYIREITVKGFWHLLQSIGVFTISTLSAGSRDTHTTN